MKKEKREKKREIDEDKKKTFLVYFSWFCQKTFSQTF